ncbi:enoyl-CoA hydratase/isomerase family protein [Kineosporia sp. J2-2]|uniref:Enoyl-CoA hydratase/isomerase family protein n=1 Tax=Kineosporia corallincola TaxID=2835133 RepID=A0ABS5THN5_9ACTN|nr:enoyl-CoA hydratase-related protein [Kineosporia corallincola]MBT0770601.1 enoyl-CoA hydratase/isomerase family protein [Kineosporia corallincola]
MIRLEQDGAVAVITLDRPRRRNALDATTKTALRAALEKVSAATSVRAVLLTGAGGSFCGGQDLAEHAETLRPGTAETHTLAAARAFATVEADYAPIVTALLTMPKPVVAAVEGTCVGAGLALALACDLRVFADDAVLATAFTAIGLTCDTGLSLTLTRSVGETRAKELILLGESFTPAQAVGWGMAGRVVKAAETLHTATQLAQRMAQGPTLAYAESKRLIGSSALATILHDEALAQTRLGATADHRQAVEAFLARRRPLFEGH